MEPGLLRSVAIATEHVLHGERDASCVTLGKCLPLSEPSIELPVLTLAISGPAQKQDKKLSRVMGEVQLL